MQAYSGIGKVICVETEWEDYAAKVTRLTATQSMMDPAPLDVQRHQS